MPWRPRRRRHAPRRPPTWMPARVPSSSRPRCSWAAAARPVASSWRAARTRRRRWRPPSWAWTSRAARCAASWSRRPPPSCARCTWPPSWTAPTQRILLMGAAEGGVEIETLAEEHPDAIIRVHAHPQLGLQPFQARQMAFALGLGDHLTQATAICQGLVGRHGPRGCRPRGGQPPGHRARGRAGRAGRAAGAPGRQDHARRFGPPAPPRPRGHARPGRGGPGRRRGPRGRASASSGSTATSAAWSTAPAWP